LRTNRSASLYALWTVCILVLVGLHFVHPLADFPNNSPWMDYSKYTDEGWYGSAAARFFLSGHWFWRGDFNAAVALPVWPLLLAGVFRFTGVSMTAARILIVAIFSANLLLSYAVLRTQAARWVALAAVTLLATSPFLYSFSRLAILEPLLVCLMLSSWLLALRLRQASARRRTGTLILIGLLSCLLVLSKTTGLLLIPSTLFLVAYAYGFRASLRPLATVAASALVPWCAWYVLLVRAHYRVDYRYLFAVNRWPQPIGLRDHLAAYWWALHGTVWISPTLCIAAIVLLALALIPPSRRAASDHPAKNAFLRNPLNGASLFAAGGYIFLIGAQNHPQPRYYETVIYPLTFLLALASADLVSRTRGMTLRLAGAAGLAVLLAVSVTGTLSIASYTRHPEYTWLNAANGVARYIDQHPAPNRMLLSISGDDLTLMTHLPSICDDFGTFDLPYRIHVYQPSWYATWNELDPGTLVDLKTQYSLEQVASFTAFDDPDRDVFILYRMHPLPPAQRDYVAAEEAKANADK
jgi:4-amino-4-deoxy-L-arabinose transferase-like glycosyltransferase